MQNETPTPEITAFATAVLDLIKQAIVGTAPEEYIDAQQSANLRCLALATGLAKHEYPGSSSP